MNFDLQIITLFKEVRNFLWLNFQVLHVIMNMVRDVKRVYPHAVSLMETVRMYGQTLDSVENNKGTEWLVAEYRNESQSMITKGSLCFCWGLVLVVSGLICGFFWLGMIIHWDHFVNQYDTSRYVSATDGRVNQHIQFI